MQAFSPFNPTAAWSAGTNGGSGYFDGTGDYLIAPTNAAFDFGSGNFTVELWFYNLIQNSNYQRIFGINTGSGTTNESIVFEIDTSGVKLFAINGSTAYGATTSTALGQNTWNHLALVRNGNTVTGYINGVSAGSSTMTVAVNFASGAFPQLGAWHQSGSYSRFINGYISNARVVNGTAVYTANFTPPTAPLTAITNTSLLCNFTNAGIFDSASGNDLETVGNAQVSTTVAKWGTTSMAFDGTGDWLVVPNRQTLRLGSANFTFEFWFYPTNLTGVKQILNTSSGVGSTNCSYAVITNGTSLLYYLSSTGTTWDIASGVSGGTVALNTWYHIALVRNGSTFNVYLNGTAGTSTTSSASLFAFTSPLGIGSDLGSTPTPMVGYIDDLRITNGYARYTSNFTAPTAAFPLQ